MSSLLTFPQPDHATLQRAKEYFRSRSNYTIDGDQFVYGNDDTGCVFIVEFDNLHHGVCFILNYNRPKPFIREGIAEVSEFNKAFPGKFLNEETDQLEDFESGRYLADWSQVNDSYVRDYVAGQDRFGQAFTSSVLIENAWSWNAMREAHMNASREDIFIAGVMWLRTATSTAVPFSIWTESISTIFPAFVERVAIGTAANDQISLGEKPSEQRNILRFVPMQTVLAHTVFDQRTVNGLSAYYVGPDIPETLLQAIQSIKPGRPDGEYLVHPSLVMEEEILSYRNRSLSS